jgi:antitoxin MazE
MRTRLARWGDSLAVRIDGALAESAALREGDAVEVVAERDGLVLRRARPRYTLEELLRDTTPEAYRAVAIDWGRDRGRERVE